jgi:hypothetical protein
MLRRILAGILAVAGTLAWCGTADAAGAIRLASHRALYEMTLDRTRSGSGIAGVAGEMAIEWLRACDGWTFQHQSSMSVEYTAGETVQLSTTATSWESFDGRHYRFSLRNLTDGEQSERIEGTAAVGGRAAGEAQLTAPKKRRFVLPGGTLFPVAHTREVLRRAMSGKPPTIFQAVVFDGMSEDGPMAATTTIGKGRRGDAAQHAAKGATQGAIGGSVAAALAGKERWPVSVAYFPMTGASPLPKQEIGMSLYADGVADDLLIGFDDFIVHARLAKLEYVESPRCDGRRR